MEIMQLYLVSSYPLPNHLGFQDTAKAEAKMMVYNVVVISSNYFMVMFLEYVSYVAPGAQTPTIVKHRIS